MAGRSLGHYELAEPLGAGAMGEVYRARDIRLDRDVAVKILPDAVAAEPSVLGRFQREARLLAALSHPNIAAIHGLEETDGLHFLVLELVDGQTLAERLAAGPLPVSRVLDICRQVAEALEAAHSKGIVHRDLKPSNIKVTPAGAAKVLDFGLAKALETASETPGEDVARTLSVEGTVPGAILGTVAYMSPEQARGESLDRRTDVWAFGCVLYETLAGRPAFPGATVSDCLAAVLKDEPDWAALPEAVPAIVRHLLRRCLTKDPDLRLHDIADARIELVGALEEPEAPPGLPPPASEMRRWRRHLARGLLLLLAAATGIGGFFLGTSSRGTAPVAAQVPVAMPLGVEAVQDSYHSLDISPDGRRLVYIGRSEGTRLYLQELFPPGRNAPIEGTEGATEPFFSPDGEWVGFYADGKLKKVALAGGRPVELADVPDLWGASWTANDEIVFSPSFAVARMPAHGGTPVVVATPDRGRGEFAYTFPQMLPGGEEVLYTVALAGTKSRVAVTSLATGRQKFLFDGGIYARYVPTGHIVFAEGSSLMAAPLDLDRLEVGTPVPILDNVLANTWDAAQYAVSGDGSLVYLSAAADPGSVLVRIDPGRARRALTTEGGGYKRLRISPDGGRIALEIQDPELGPDIWIYSISRDDFSRMTFQPGYEGFPVWTPDGQKVAFTASWGQSGAIADVFWKSVDGATAERFEISADWISPGSFSPDGKLLALVPYDPDTGDDIWILPTENQDAAEPFLATPFEEGQPIFSPDGRWLAYQSDETGRPEVYVRAYPGPGGAWKVSTAGGNEPRWSADGRRIFYREEDRAMVVEVQDGPDFSTSLPEPIVDGLAAEWDVSPDGTFFVTLEAEPREPPRLNLILNWFEELRRLVPRR